MTTRIGTDVQFGPDDIHHKYLAASDGHAGFGTVKIGTPGVGGNATLYFQDTALIDAMVTHLAELKTEMLAAQQPEPTGEPNPPRHVVDDKQSCTAPGHMNLGYICTAQDGHDGPDHIAYKPFGGEYHRWPVAGADHDYVTPAMADRRDGAAAAYEADTQAAGQ